MRLLAAALAICTTLLVAAPAVAKAPPKGRCTLHRHPHARSGRRILVFGVRRLDPSDAPETVYFVCLRPRGPGLVLGVNGPDMGVYGPGGTARGFVIAGAYAAAHESQGEADYTECTKYQVFGCPPPTAWIEVIEARSRRKASVPVPFVYDPHSSAPRDLPLALSAAGALAWLQPQTGGGYQLWASALRPRGNQGLRTSPSMLDSGNIPAGSLRFTNGRTVTWTKDGVSHHITVT